MKEEKRIIIKGEFKRKNIPFAFKIITVFIILLMCYFTFPLAFSSLIILKLIGLGLSASLLYMLWSFLTKGASMGIYKIELYEDEIWLKQSLLLTDKFRYDDIEDCYCIEHLLYVKIKENNKVYKFAFVENNREIVEFIHKKLEDDYNYYNFQDGTKGNSSAFTNSSSYNNYGSQSRTNGKEYASLNSMAGHNLNLQFEKEKKEYLARKKKLYINIAVGVSVLVLFIASNVICRLLAKEQHTNNEMIVSLIFSGAIAFLPVILVSCLQSIKNSIKKYRKAKSYYARKLSGSCINDGLSEGSVRVIKMEDGGRIVIYYDRFKGTYKCSHESFVFESKTWKFLKASNEYKSMEEVENYLRDYRAKFL